MVVFTLSSSLCDWRVNRELGAGDICAFDVRINQRTCSNWAPRMFPDSIICLKRETSIPLGKVWYTLAQHCLRVYHYLAVEPTIHKLSVMLGYPPFSLFSCSH